MCAQAAWAAAGMQWDRLPRLPAEQLCAGQRPAGDVHGCDHTHARLLAFASAARLTVCSLVAMCACVQQLDCDEGVHRLCGWLVVCDGTASLACQWSSCAQGSGLLVLPGWMADQGPG